MALSKLITMYSKSTMQVLSLYRASCHCQGQHNARNVASLARLKDADDRIWRINRRQKTSLRKIYQLKNNIQSSAPLYLNYQRKNIALHPRLFNNPSYFNRCMIHTTAAVCDDKDGTDEKGKRKGDSRDDIVFSNERDKTLKGKAILESDSEKKEHDNRLSESVNNEMSDSAYNGIDIDGNSSKLTLSKTESVDSCLDCKGAPEPALTEQEGPDIGTKTKKGTLSLQPVLNNEMSEKILDPQNYMLKRGILKFFDENDLNHTESYTGYYIVCPKFGKVAMKRNKEEHRIYINYLTGSFKCSACGKTGNWNQLKDNVTHILLKKGRRKTNMECFKDMLDLDLTLEKQEWIDRVKEQLDEAKDLWTIESDEFENILSLFDWQGITKQTFKKYGVKYIQTDNKYSVYFPLVSLNQDLTGTRVYTAVITEEEDVKLEPVVTIPKLSEADIFGWQTRPVPDNKNYYRNLVITTGEIQAMAVTQQTTFTAVSIKNIDNFAQEHVPNLEKFEKIFLWLGTDLKAWEMSKLVAKRLNDKRCLIFRPANVNEMPLECIHTEEDIRNKLKIARPLSHEAIHQFQHLRLEVYREFSHHEHVTGVKWKKYFKLNDILKGFRQGELTVLTGPTGSGKTTFLSEYSLDLCMQGVNTLWGSFEISNVRLIKIMMQQLSGKNLAKHLDEFDDTAKEFMGLPMYFMAYHGSQNVNTVLETMCHAVYVHNIQHVILDNLQFMVGLDHFDDPIQNIFLRQDRIVSQFRKFATENNCHVTLIIHPRKIDKGEELSVSSIFGSAKVSQEADNIYLIQDNRLSKPGGRKYLQITKNRFDGDLGVMTLTFDKESLSFSMTPKKKPNQVEL